MREARRWKRLRPWWSPQQQGRRSSFVGLSNLGINRCLYVLVVVLFAITCSWLSAFLSIYFLGFGPNLKSGVILASRDWPYISTKPLESGVVSDFILKIHIVTDFVVHVGVETSTSLRWNFRHPEVPTQTAGSFGTYENCTTSAKTNFEWKISYNPTP